MGLEDGSFNKKERYSRKKEKLFLKLEIPSFE